MNEDHDECAADHNKTTAALGECCKYMYQLRMNLLQVQHDVNPLSSAPLLQVSWMRQMPFVSWKSGLMLLWHSLETILLARRKEVAARGYRPLERIYRPLERIITLPPPLQVVVRGPSIFAVGRVVNAPS